MGNVTKAQNTAVAVADIEAFGGMGFEETTSEDMSIPFLRILDTSSPQVDERAGEYVKGAKAGMIYNTVADQAYDGIKGITVVPCYYNRRFVEWKPRTEGGGYVDAYRPDNKIVGTTTKNDLGQDMLPNGNTLVNTAQFFVILITEEGMQKCLITMSSTQLKKAKKWVTQMQSLTGIHSKTGKPYTLPMMLHRYQLTTVPERNDKGSWSGWDVVKVDKLDLEKPEDKILFDDAVSFHTSVASGDVKVKESDSTEKVEDDDIPF